MEEHICYQCFQTVPDGAAACPHCGYPTGQSGQNNINALPCGTVVGRRYLIGRVLGQGGFGITYCALDQKTGERVALKEYYPQTLVNRTGSTVVPTTEPNAADFEAGKRSFLDEANTLSEFRNNPAIVRIYTYFEHNGTAYYAMEYAEGQTLMQYLRQNGTLEWPEAKKLLLPLINALEAVHARGIVHRDIKPANIIVDGRGGVKLLDFGAARYAMSQQSQSISVVLSHGYAPKEQYSRHGRQGPYSDVYALAATFYFALTGIPLQDAIDRLDDDRLVPVDRICQSIPRMEAEALMKALAVDAKDRWQTMGEFRRALTETVRREEDAPTNWIEFDENADETVREQAPKAQPAWTQSSAPPVQQSGPQPAWTQQPAPPAQQSGPPPAWTQQPAPPTQQPEAQPKKEKPKKKKHGWLIALLIAALLGGAGFYAYRLSQTPVVQFDELAYSVYAKLFKAETHALREDSFPMVSLKELPNQPVLGSRIYKRRDIEAIQFYGDLDSVGADAWDVSAAQDGSVKAWVEMMDGNRTLFIAADGLVAAPENSSMLFAGYANVRSIKLYDIGYVNMDGVSQPTYRDVFDTADVKDMSYLFYGCKSLTWVDLSGLRTRNVTNMSNMFANCNNLVELDVSTFYTGNVTDMSYMFYGCGRLKELDVSNFNTAKVEKYNDFMPDALNQDWENMFH